MVDWWCCRDEGVWKISPQTEHGWMSGAMSCRVCGASGTMRGGFRRRERVEEDGDGKEGGGGGMWEGEGEEKRRLR